MLSPNIESFLPLRDRMGVPVSVESGRSVSSSLSGAVVVSSAVVTSDEVSDVVSCEVEEPLLHAIRERRGKKLIFS